ncbi:MAG TPA: hypothetical protein VFE50_08615 [Cyclobacteriaceae bacterium]|nr:hypothetical protein [Cyclobacteriaceae bacterium]
MIRFLPGMLILLLLTHVDGRAQNKLISQLKISETAPEKLLSSRSLVLFDNTITSEELSNVQKAFQQIGIDADFYVDIAKVIAGLDTERAYSAYFTSREITFLIFLTRSADGYNFLATEYNNTMQFVTTGQPAWKVTNRRLDELMTTVYRDSWLREKKQNFLINDIPEMDIVVPVVAGRRSELFPIDLRIDKLALPRLDDTALQAEVDTLFKKIYPYPEKYQVVKMPADEKDLVKQGFQYVLLYLQVNGKTAREILGYDMSKNLATAYGSVTYPNGAPQVKTISVEQPVFKFYIKHIRSGNIFLGTKWDADETLVQALKNHIMGFRTELKLN